MPLTFIAPEKSDRLSILYSILVKQYSISKKEYKFWEDLKKVNETNGDIFGSLPFPVFSNISNIHNSNERVLGYFQVSAVKQRRKYITFMESVELNLPFYHYDCKRIEASPADYACSYCPPVTIGEIIKIFGTNPNYSFVEPVFNSGSNIPVKLVFSTRICSDCEMAGTLQKPDFWVDLN
jgi:hypothetical protein